MSKKSKISIFAIFSIISFYLSLKFIFPIFLQEKLTTILQQELGEKISIEKIKIEPLYLDAEILNLKISDKLAVQKVYVNLSVLQIFNDKITLQKIDLEGVKTSLYSKNTKWHVKGLEKLTHVKPINEKIEKEASEKIWKIELKEFNVQKSLVKINDDDFLIKSFGIKDFNSYATNQELQFQGSLGVKDSEHNFNGKIANYLSEPTGAIEFKLNGFDLEIINSLNIIENNFIVGDVWTEGILILNKNLTKLDFDLTLKNFKGYSGDRKEVNYFAKEIVVKDAKVALSELITFNSSLINIKSPILSISEAKLSKRDNSSKFLEVNLSDVVYEMKKNPSFIDGETLMKISASYNNEGIISVQKKMKNSEKILNLDIKNMDLTPLAGALQESLGYHINSGKLNLGLKTKTKGKKVKGEAKVVLSQFSLDDQDEKGRKIENDSSIPLPSAISMIKSDEGSIKLSLEISGNEENPNFGFLSMLKKGLGSIILSEFTTMVGTKAAAKFLPMLVSSIPFSPANAFLLVKGVYKFASKPRFEDIEFDPQEVSIKKRSIEQVEKLSSFLKDNKDVYFNLCPKVTRFENKEELAQPTLSEEMAFDLAKRRISTLKEMFGTYKIPSNQIVFCRPKISAQKVKSGITVISL